MDSEKNLSQCHFSHHKDQLPYNHLNIASVFIFEFVLLMFQPPESDFVLVQTMHRNLLINSIIVN
jgi:hypothetical protein